MYNFILLGKRKKQETLHYIGLSKLTGQPCYEILLDKCNKDDILVEKFHCRSKNIITDPELIDLHICSRDMKNTINIFDPYNYKNL